MRSQAVFEKAEARRVLYEFRGPAGAGSTGGEVVIGISPGFGTSIFRSLAGQPVSEMLDAVLRGVTRAGGTARVVRMRHTADTSFLGLSAAGLSGSGVGIGLQAKGTAVIHRRDRLPHHNLELFSNAPVTTLDHYRGSAAMPPPTRSAASPEPIVVPTGGIALGARFHAEVAMLYAIETAICGMAPAPEETRRAVLGRDRGMSDPSASTTTRLPRSGPRPCRRARASRWAKSR